jgi:hypothetical protein
MERIVTVCRHGVYARREGWPEKDKKKPEI